MKGVVCDTHQFISVSRGDRGKCASWEHLLRLCRDRECPLLHSSLTVIELLRSIRLRNDAKAISTTRSVARLIISTCDGIAPHPSDILISLYAGRRYRHYERANRWLAERLGEAAATPPAGYPELQRRVSLWLEDPRSRFEDALERMKRERYSHLIDLDTIVPLSANEFAKRGLIPRARLAEFAKGDGLKTLRARILPCLRIIENTARKTAHRNINLDGKILHNWEDHYFMLYPSTRYALVTNDRNMLQAAQGTNHAKLVCRLEEAPSLFQGGA